MLPRRRVLRWFLADFSFKSRIFRNGPVENRRSAPTSLYRTPLWAFRTEDDRHEIPADDAISAQGLENVPH